jgi:hypothetical protein
MGLIGPSITRRQFLELGAGASVALGLSGFLMPATIVDPLKSIEVEEYQSDQLTIRKGLVKPAFKLTPGR